MKPAKELAKALPYPALLRVFLLNYRFRELRRHRAVRRRLQLPLLDAIDLARFKASDTLVVLGSGPSINQISAERWQALAQNDTAAMNFWLFHPFVPKFYFYEHISQVAQPDMGQLFLEVARRRAGDYRETVKVATELHLTPSLAARELPPEWYENLFTIYPVQFPARSEAEMRYALRYFAARGAWRETSRIRRAIKYSSTLSVLLSFAAMLRYRRIILCGVDLASSGYFYQDRDLYPQTSSVEFIDRTQKHGTFRELPWLVPMDVVLDAMRYEVLAPLRIEVFVESKSSALWPKTPEISESALFRV